MEQILHKNKIFTRVLDYLPYKEIRNICLINKFTHNFIWNENFIKNRFYSNGISKEHDLPVFFILI